MGLSSSWKECSMIFESRDELVKPFWTPTFAYKIGNGLSKLGWLPSEEIEFWLAERIINQLLEKQKIKAPNNS